jgi:hypothetical protein
VLPGASDALGRLGAALVLLAFPVALVSVVVVVVTPLGGVLLPLLGVTLPPSSDWIRPSSLPISATAHATMPAKGPPGCARTVAISSTIPASISLMPPVISLPGVGAGALGAVTLVPVPLLVPLIDAALLPSLWERVQRPVIVVSRPLVGEVGEFAHPRGNVLGHRMDARAPPLHA